MSAFQNNWSNSGTILNRARATIGESSNYSGYDTKRNSYIGNSVSSYSGNETLSEKNCSYSTPSNATDCLDRGHYVGVFPEGFINREDVLKTFKSGVVMMALMSGKPIIPIYIKRRKNWFQRQRVAVGEAIYVSDYFTSRFPSMEEINKVTELVRVKEMKLKEMVGEKNEN